MGLKGRHISLVLLLVLLCGMPVKAEPFGQFLINFLNNPSSQVKKAVHNLKINDVGHKSGKDGYIVMSPVAILCTDSIDSPYMNDPKTLSVATVNLEIRDYKCYDFRRLGKTYQLVKGEVSKKEVDYEFITFLNEYSRNHDMQMKRTIFPIPIRQFAGKKEGDCKLLMPREWKYLDFSNVTPTLCLCVDPQQNNNRRLYVYKDAKLTQVYNFICINKRWYLIEVENH